MQNKQHNTKTNMKKLALLALCAAGVAVTSGCRTNLGGGIMASTKPVEQGKYDVLGDRVSGYESSWYGPFGISYAKPGNAALRCLDEAKAKAPGADALIEVGQNMEMVNYGVARQIITRVEGTPVKTK